MSVPPGTLTSVPASVWLGRIVVDMVTIALVFIVAVFVDDIVFFLVGIAIVVVTTDALIIFTGGLDISFTRGVVIYATVLAIVDILVDVTVVLVVVIILVLVVVACLRRLQLWLLLMSLL